MQSHRLQLVRDALALEFANDNWMEPHEKSDDQFLEKNRKRTAIEDLESNPLRQQRGIAESCLEIGPQAWAVAAYDPLQRFDWIVKGNFRQNINGAIEQLLASLEFRT
jgi:hypothetical protein